MQAVQISAPHLVELVTQPLPKPKQGEALLRILYGGICGSGLGSFRGTFAYYGVQKANVKPGEIALVMGRAADQPDISIPGGSECL